MEADTTGRLIRFGLMDESGKININALPKLVSDNAAARLVLTYLPGMTPEVADAILDWVDTNTTARENGAEDDVYSALGYKAKNGPIDTLDELLLVRGVTPFLLFGEDANRNGLLDPAENDGEVNPPIDNADGLLNRGWAAYLTVNSREGNVRANGLPRINVNMAALGDLYDQIQPEFGDDVAKFIVAYRMQAASSTSSTSGSGASGSGNSGSSGGNSGGSSGNSGGGSGGGGSGGSQSSGSGGNSGSGSSGSSRGSGSTASSGSGNSGSGGGSSGSGNSPGVGTATVTAVVQQTAQTFSAVATNAMTGSVTRGNLDLTAGGQRQITSLYELLDGSITVKQVDNTNVTLKSPWTSDSANMRQNLPKIMDTLATNTDQYIEGRINVNEARAEVLMGLPNMTQPIVEQIIAAQQAGLSISDPNSDRVTSGWLVINGIVDLDTMKTLDKYVTARGDVYRLQSVGYYEQGGPTARIEAVIDATQDPPEIVFMRDLTDLGRGFSPQLLTTGTGGTQ
jgi:DNA uptake protein ComE-like DNA-binding protein